MGNEEYRKIVDSQSGKYDKERVKSYFLKTSKLFKRIIPKGKSVLEIGSGTGLYVLDLTKSGRTAVGVDYSKKMVELAKKNAKRADIEPRFFYGDVEQSIPVNEKFDYVLIGACWEYFEKPENVLLNARDVLKDDGMVIINTVNVFSWPLIALLEKTGIKKLSPAFWYFNSRASRVKALAKKTGYSLARSFLNYYFLNKIIILKKNPGVGDKKYAKTAA